MPDLSSKETKATQNIEAQVQKRGRLRFSNSSALLKALPMSFLIIQLGANILGDIRAKLTVWSPFTRRHG